MVAGRQAANLLISSSDGAVATGGITVGSGSRNGAH